MQKNKLLITAIKISISEINYPLANRFRHFITEIERQQLNMIMYYSLCIIISN